MISRREWMLASATAAVAKTAGGAPGAPGDIVISSANGTRACAKAMEILKAGGDTLDAVIAGVNIVEEDPNDTSVGYGGLPNEDCVVELDSCVMHGPSRRCGSVGALPGIKTPSKVARVVMEETDHIMLVGEEALRFAQLQGFKKENLLTERARKTWLAWKESLRDARGHNNWTPGIDAPPENSSARLRRLFPGASREMLAWVRDVITNPPTGTINCMALNRKGEMSGVTTTSGLAWKIPGRVGDSPIIGAGLFVDQDVGGAGSTGRGEENIRVVGAHTVVENMRHGMTAAEAVLDCLKRVARNFDNDHSRLGEFGLKFYALRKDGDFAAGALWNGRFVDGKLGRARFCYNDGTGSHLKDCVYLYERKQ